MPALRRASELRQVEWTEAALRIIATKGLGASSARSLAAQVGLSRGAIFRHFVAHVVPVLESAYLAPVVMGTVQMLALSPAKARQREAEARAVLDNSLLALLRAPAGAPTSSRRRSP
jgi:Bacterial regulatory proteins, tetR family